MKQWIERKELTSSQTFAFRIADGKVKNLLAENEKKQAQLMAAASEASLSVRRKGIELHYKLRIAIWESWTGRILTFLSVLGAITGAFIARKGFNAWFLRVQVLQDAVLKKQAEG